MFPKIYSDEGDIQFPVVFKPLSKEGDESSFLNLFGKKVVLINNGQELVEIQKKYKFDYQLQEEVSFDMGGEFSFLGIGANGTVKGFTFQHRYKYPNKEGRLTCLEYIDSNPLLELVRSIEQNINLNGVFDIQFLKCKITGRYFLIEINPRFTSGREVLHNNGIHWEVNWAEEYYDLNDNTLDLNDKVTLNRWYSSLFIFNKFSQGLIKGREFNGISKERFFVKIKLLIFVLLKRVVYFKQILWRT